MFQNLASQGDREFLQALQIGETIKISDFFNAFDRNMCENFDQNTFSAIASFFKNRNLYKDKGGLIPSLKKRCNVACPRCRDNEGVSTAVDQV